MTIAEQFHASGTALLQRTPALDGQNPESKRAEIADYYNAVSDRYESLFQTLACDEAYYKKAIPLRHPLIFYYGHTATFFVNKLVLAKLLPERIDPRLESIFAVGVDEMSWDDLDETHYEWPSVAEVKAYREKVRAAVLNLIHTLPLQLPITWSGSWWPIIMGIEHELIHLETSTVLIRQHRLEYLRGDADWAPSGEHGPAPVNELLTVAGGSVSLGKPRDAISYGWDNEYGHREVELEEFKASKYLVSNGEFLEFVEAGGYQNDAFWDAEGTQWKQFAQAAHPTFWIPGAQWHLRLMTEEVDMRWDWPAEVNYHEAKAFFNWKAEQSGKPVRLPTEDEWYRLYDVAQPGEVPSDGPASANLQLDHGASSCPVNRFAHGEFFDVVGNVWQWTETPMYPYDGFEVHPLYDDFTTPTFDNQHNLIKGGSWVSCGNETLRSARYAFRRHFFQHAGFRYVSSHAKAKEPNAYYESDRQMSEYAEFHYGDTWFNVPNFPAAVAQLCIEAMGERPAQSALDLGCASGRATFELARHFDQVTGIDFSARFVSQGVEMAEQGVLRYTLTEEGDLVSYRTATLEQHGLENTTDKVSFFQGDACNLKPQLTGYDLIMAVNLIDRLYNPGQFLGQVHQRINLGGLLVVASPYTWLEEHTPKEQWIGGYKKDGESYTTLDGLRDILGDHFVQIGDPRKLEFVIRETQHKFQHSFSEVTVWERIR
ncbi:5-histidylcysteine sulfoxide synthase [uncultured Halopseudomonas sp.]|uniref:5-histidylcysteine sulfoxide synthase n=1 Tax=uncultured Halopseudomonas sp. TaxID=2901193 RepID=UPI0030ECFBF5|tara:strand:+ start:21297 stop:23432 length:2136 start_codon:yes stop_codon:yes gene_type:complete